MKIKCPVEYCSYERDTTYYPNIMKGNFVDHFKSHHNEHLLSFALADLLYKIYEKIEGLKDGRLLIDQPLGFTEEVLKSLLEK